MKKRMRILVWLIIVSVFITGGFVSKDKSSKMNETNVTYYVSVKGNDNNPGTLAKPFKTMEKARQEVRKVNKNMKSDIVVYIMEGNYFLNKTIYFTQEDSGTNGHKVIYKNYNDPGSAKILGGKALTSWEKHDENIYKINVGNKWKFNALFEKGKRCDIARYPDKGYLRIRNKDRQFPKKVFYFYPEDIPQLTDISDLEVYVFPGAHDWSNDIIEVNNIDFDNNKVTLKRNQKYRYLGDLSKNSRFFIQGSLELLNKPGEFYLDKDTGWLYYWPNNKESLENGDIIAPTVQRVISIKGDLEKDIKQSQLEDVSFVENISFEGLTISYSDCAMNLFNTTGAGNISIENAKNIEIKNCRITNALANGIAVKNYAQDNVIEGNVILEVGASGIIFQGMSNTSREMNLRNKVVNNFISDIAKISVNGAGILLNQSGYNLISRNKIADASHYAIESKGSKYVHMPKVIEGETVDKSDPIKASKFNPGKYNVISYNDLSYCNLDTSDTGVYKSGGAIFNIIINNKLYNSGVFGIQKGLYLDDVSDYTTIKNNIVYGIGKYATYGMAYNIKGVENIMTNNVADYSEIASGIGINNHEMHNQPVADNHITKNIFYSSDKGNGYYFISWEDDRIKESDYNVFYHGDGNYNMFGIPGDDTFDNWKTLLDGKFDKHSVTKDPLFKDVKKHDYTLQEGSPALELGFKQIDTTQIGLNNQFKYMDEVNKVVSQIPEIKAVEDSGSNEDIPVLAEEKELINVIEDMKNIRDWDGWVETKDNSITIDGNKNRAIYSGAKYQNAIFEFKMKYDFEDGVGHWPSIELRSQNRYAGGWNNDNAYLLVIKKDYFELQKRLRSGRNVFLIEKEQVLNEVIESNKECKISVGALDVEGGVKIFLYVNDEPVFEILDNEDPITKGGFFGFYAWKSPITLNNNGLSNESSEVFDKVGNIVKKVDGGLNMNQKVEEGSFEENALEYKWKCTPTKGLPNVLILGDSISIGYTLLVRESLEGKANVYRPIKDEGKLPFNCGDTKMGVNNIDNWLGNEKWDVIHFNFGLHDLKRLIPGVGPKESNDPTRPTLNTVEEYKQNLEKIVKRLKQTNAKLIFATTTPYPSGVTPSRLPEDAIKYNEAALEIMRKYNIEVNDLYALTLPKLEELQLPVNVHFTQEGSEYIANSITEIILKYVTEQ